MAGFAVSAWLIYGKHDKMLADLAREHNTSQSKVIMMSIEHEYERLQFTRQAVKDAERRRVQEANHA